MTAKEKHLSISFASLLVLLCFITYIDFFSYILQLIASFCKYRYLLDHKFVDHCFVVINHMLSYYKIE